MELDPAMIVVAGIGCRRGVAAGEVLAAVQACVVVHEQAAPTHLSTATLKRDESGIAEAARQLGLPLVVVDDDALQTVAPRALTRSARSLDAAGVPSVAECAALAAAGDGSRLLGPRTIVGRVTCAIAVGRP